MSCQSIRNRILATEDASRLPGELDAHLEQCDDCRSWQGRFMSIDRALKELPAPEVDGLAKKAVLARIAAKAAPAEFTPAAAPEKVAPAVRTDPDVNHKTPAAIVFKPLNLADDLPPARYSAGRLAAFWPAGLVAATILIFTVAWLGLRDDKAPGPIPDPRDPFLESLVRRNVDLADPAKQTPAQRVQVLALVAEDLNTEMRDIARADATGENMRDLEKMYHKVVLDGLVAQAKLVERSQRKTVLLKIAETLAQSGRNAEQTAKDSPQHSAGPLHEAADAARKGTEQIYRLIREES